MPLYVGVAFEARFPGDSRLNILREPLAARGDTVTAWTLDAPVSALDRLRLYPRIVRDLVAARARKQLDVVVLSGSTRALALLASSARLTDVEVVLDVTVDPTDRLRGLLDVVVAASATRVLARDPASYEALLSAGVPAYRVGLVVDPLVGAVYVPRAKEPVLKGRLRVWATVVEATDLEPALAALAAARAVEPKLFAELRVPAELVAAAQARAAALEVPASVSALAGEGVPPDSALVDAHIALVWGASARARHAAGAAMASAVPLVWAAADAPWGAEGAELLAPDASLGARLATIARDKNARAALTARGRAWDEVYGWAAQSRLWLRAIDAACEAKVVAERRARQAAIDGVKTGTRKT